MKLEEFYKELRKGRTRFNGLRITGTKTRKDEEEFPKELHYTLRKYDLRGCILENLYLPEIRIIQSNLEGISIINSELEGALLTGSMMKKATGIRTNYHNTGFTNTDQEEAVYLECNLENARYNNAYMKETIFGANTNLTDTGKGLREAQHNKEIRFHNIIIKDETTKKIIEELQS